MSEETTVKTTEKDFQIFKKKAVYWIEKLGLKNWRVVYEHSLVRDEGVAHNYSYLPGMVCTLTLSTEYDADDYSEYSIRRSAFHEVIELLLARLCICGKSRFVTADELEESRHEIIRVLENVMFDSYWQRENAS